MGYLDPVLPLVCALISGYAFCLFLSTLRSKAKVALVATVILVAATIISLYGMREEAEFLISVPLAGVSFLLGYLLMSISLGKGAPDRLDNNDYEVVGGEGAVIYLCQGEPEHYSAMVSRRVRRDEALGGAGWMVIRRPLAFLRLRQAYAKMGRSTHRERHQIIVTGLRERLSASEFDPPVLVAFQEDQPSFETVMGELLGKGIERIVVARSYLVEIWETEKTVERLKGGEVDVTLTEPLWDSFRLRELTTRRVKPEIRGKGGEVAVFLVASVPERVGGRMKEAGEREQDHLALLREDLLKLGMGEVRIAKVGRQLEKACREMVQKGIGKVAFLHPFETVDSIDGILLMDDIREWVGEGVDVIRIGAWNDDEEVAQVLAERIAAAFSLDRG